MILVYLIKLTDGGPNPYQIKNNMQYKGSYVKVIKSVIVENHESYSEKAGALLAECRELNLLDSIHND